MLVSACGKLLNWNPVSEAQILRKAVTCILFDLAERAKSLRFPRQRFYGRITDLNSALPMPAQVLVRGQAIHPKAYPAARDPKMASKR